MGEMICVCREIDKNTEEIAVYPIKAEVTDRLFSVLGFGKGKSHFPGRVVTDKRTGSIFSQVGPAVIKTFSRKAT